MQQLLGDKFSATDISLLRELFLQRLPSHVQMVLASLEFKDLDSLALTADKIYIEVSTNLQYNILCYVDRLRTEISDLREMVESLVASNSRPTSRARTPRPCSPSPSFAMDPAPSDLCWYHQRFGSNARKCRPPCSHLGNDQAST